MTDFEKLGQFYLGRKYDMAGKTLQEDLLLYDSKDMVTHGVCVGMTGSGKTGLCIGLLEEAAIDNIPSIVIDPKGDMSNLLLTFPDLTAEEFLPWVNHDDAQRSGETLEQFSQTQAAAWKKGLADWGQDGRRVQKLKDSAEFLLYTPGSNAGLPLSILNSFCRPSQEVLDDSEARADLIASLATGLLGLIGIAADPLKSREHVLISSIIHQAWSEGRDLDLATLISAIQTPPFKQIGAFAVDSFFPARERFDLALSLNNLLAAPGFAVWMQGDPLDVAGLLYSPAGKPRVSVISIAHLSDNERMFFVTLLLNQVVSWMRSQPGTTSLRALIYMDEVAGYLPPVANPPSKKPLMILFKQARAFGVGVLLATQNPADLDYKALSNAGTWFIGRLQTEQDVNRVVQGLATSTGGTDAKLAKAISALGKRVFLLKNIHEDETEIFQTRWCLSYLRGPLTLAQIKTLSAKAKTADTAVRTQVNNAVEVVAGSVRPSVPPQISEYFAPVRGSKPADAKLNYQPYILGLGDVTSVGGTSLRQSWITAIEDDAVPVNWDESRSVSLDENDLVKQPEENAGYVALLSAAVKAANYKTWSRDFADYLYRTVKLEVFESIELKEKSKPGESERDFRVRLSQMARESRDHQAELLRRKYAAKIATLQERVMRAQQRMEKERADVRSQGLQTAVSIGATILGAFMGRKKLSATTINRASTAMRNGMRAAKEQGDLSNANESLEVLQQRLTDLQNEFESEMQAIEASTDPLQQKISTTTIRPKKTDIKVRLVALLWLPHWIDANGNASPCFE